MQQRFTEDDNLHFDYKQHHHYQIIKRFGEMFIKIYISIANCCTSEKCSSMRKDSRIRVKISSTYCVFVILCMKCVKCYISTIFLETTKLHSVYLSIYLKIYL